MSRVRFALHAGLLSIALVLAAGAPAAASTVRESRTTLFLCSQGYWRYNGNVKWSDTTNHRLSIDRVNITKAYINGTSDSILLHGAAVAVYDGNGTRYRNNGSPVPLDQTGAAFYWPQLWKTATQARLSAPKP